MKEQILQIRTGSTGIPAGIEAVQGDSGRIVRCIIADMILLEGSTVRLYAKKPSGAEIYNDCEISGNTVLIELTTQILAETGKTCCQIEIAYSGKTVTSFEFFIIVKKRLKSDSAIESTNEFGALEEALKKVEEPGEIPVNFSDAEERQALKTGEKLSVLIGKISKWLKGLGTAAFYEVANNLITTAAGYVMDARQGRVLDAKITELNTKSLKYKQVTGTTDAGGNLILPTSIRQVLSIYPVTVDVAIIKFFTNSFGTRYVTLQKWSNGELLANSDATVNVVYSEV